MLHNQKHVGWDLDNKGIALIFMHVLCMYLIPQSFVSLTIFDIVYNVLYIIKDIIQRY
jgi:hypothetical protein